MSATKAKGDQVCGLCGSEAYSYDDRPPSYQFIVVRYGRCIKCRPDLFFVKKTTK